MRRSVSQSVYFMLPEAVSPLQNKLSCFLYCARLRVFLLVAFRNLFETSGRFTLRVDAEVRDFNVRDGVVGPT
jgi:hypothetical protein